MSKLFRKKDDRSRGFTLIEIVLVLAIAGLIFVIVFLAVSAAQRARRDTARKNDAGRYLSAAEQYASNNGGAYPTTSIVSTYVTNGGSTFDDPSTGTVYTVTVGTAATGYDAAGEISASINANCGTGNTMVAGGGNRVFAVAVFQENGGSYCVDSQ